MLPAAAGQWSSGAQGHQGRGCQPRQCQQCQGLGGTPVTQRHSGLRSFPVSCWIREQNPNRGGPATVTSGGAHLGLAIACSELWGTVIVFNCIWHRAVPSASPRAAELSVALSRPWCLGKDSVFRAVGMDTGCPGPEVTGGVPGGFSTVLRGRMCRTVSQILQVWLCCAPGFAGRAETLHWFCQQPLSQHTLPMAGHTLGLTLETTTRAGAGGHSTATPLWGHDWGHCKAEERDFWLIKSYVIFYFALPVFSSLCRKLLSWPLRFSSHSSSLQQLSPAHNKL